RDSVEPLDLASAEEQSLLVPRKSLVTLGQARENLARKFPAAQQAVAAFIGDLLLENCTYDKKLTQLSREPRLAALYEGDRYAPGQIIVREGELVTERIKAALDELATVVPPPTPVPAPQVVLVPAEKQSPYLFYGSGALLFLCLMCVIVSWRFLFASRKSNALI